MSTVHTYVAHTSNICIEKSGENNDAVDCKTYDSPDDLECAEIVRKHEMKYKPKHQAVAVKSTRKSKSKVLRLESFLTSDRRRSLAAEITRRARIYKEVFSLIIYYISSFNLFMNNF